MTYAQDGGAGGEALAEALEYVAAGYAVAPVTLALDGRGKKAARFHTEWQKDPDAITRDPDQVVAWAARWPGCGFHAPCGPNGIVVADGDVQHDARGRKVSDGVRAWGNASGPDSPMTVTTRSGGRHWYFRAPQDPIRNSAKAVLGVPSVDVRGEGGTVFISGTTVHGGGGHYAATRIVPAADLPELDEVWAKRLREAGPSAKTTGTRDRITPAVEREAPPERPRLVLSSKVKSADWIVAKVDDELRELARGGEANFHQRLFGVAAIVYRAVGVGLVDQDEAEDRLREAIIAAWGNEPDPDDLKWVEEARQKALADPWRVRAEVTPDAPEGADESEDEGEDEGDEAPRTTWWPRELDRFLVDDPDEIEEDPPPAALARTDGVRLLYAGKVNGLIGESESGKSWVAMHAAEQAITAGEDVLYLDFEDSARGVTGRLRALGAAPASMRKCFAYIGPEESLSRLAERDLDEVLEARSWALIVVDGVNMAMTLLGLDLQSNTDASRFFADLLRPLARSGAAVLTVDHVPKSADNRGKGGIGAQAKRAMTDGAAILVTVAEPFGRGQTGKLKLTIDKDRPGHVRGVAVDSSWLGTAVLESDSETGSVEVRIEAGRDGGGRREPTIVMSKVSTFLQGSAGEEWSNGAIAEAVGGKKAVVLNALDALALRGHVTRRPGARGATLNVFVSRFSDFVGAVQDAPASLVEGLDEDDEP